MLRCGMGGSMRSLLLSFLVALSFAAPVWADNIVEKVKDNALAQAKMFTTLIKPLGVSQLYEVKQVPAAQDLTCTAKVLGYEAYVDFGSDRFLMEIFKAGSLDFAGWQRAAKIDPSINPSRPQPTTRVMSLRRPSQCSSAIFLEAGACKIRSTTACAIAAVALSL